MAGPLSPTFKVRDAQLVSVHNLWPHRYPESDPRQCLVCKSDGPCELRGIPDGHPIRTSLVESINEDKTVVLTLNSIYEVSSWSN